MRTAIKKIKNKNRRQGRAAVLNRLFFAMRIINRFSAQKRKIMTGCTYLLSFCYIRIVPQQALPQHNKEEKYDDWRKLSGGIINSR